MCIGTWIVGCPFQNLAWLFSPKYIDPFSSNAPDRWCHEADNTSFRQLPLIKHITQLCRCSGQALGSIRESGDTVTWSHIMVLLFPTFCQNLKRSSGISMWVVLNTRSYSTGAYIYISMLCMYLDTICLAYSAQFSFQWHQHRINWKRRA